MWGRSRGGWPIAAIAVFPGAALCLLLIAIGLFIAFGL
jgi:hypothetical protein